MVVFSQALEISRQYLLLRAVIIYQKNSLGAPELIVYSLFLLKSKLTPSEASHRRRLALRGL